MLKIDYQFISKLEGGQRLKGYTIQIKDSESGVTIATGVDLGQRSQTEIMKLKIPDALIGRLKPYALAKGLDASRLLHERPITITTDEADMLDKAVYGQIISRLILQYEGHTGKKYGDLARGIQTAVASIAINAGADFRIKMPTAWEFIVEQCWDELAAHLKNFPTSKAWLKTRRALEGQLIYWAA